MSLPLPKLLAHRARRAIIRSGKDRDVCLARMTSLDIEKVIDGSRDEKEEGEGDGRERGNFGAEELLRSASDSADSGENFEQL